MWRLFLRHYGVYFMLGRLHMRKGIAKISDVIGLLVSALPFIVIVLFYMYVVRVRMVVGYWPTPYHPESWSIGFPTHYSFLRPWVYGFYFGSIWIMIPLICLYG